MKHNAMKTIYFKGLNEIRALASLAVLLHHLEFYKKKAGAQTLLNTPLKTFIVDLGSNGVAVFFVLSGFLITYLLLAEKERFANINLKKFYFRRILRIWPLYYLIVFLSFAIIPNVAQHWEPMQHEAFYYSRILKLPQIYAPALWLFLLFLPNLALRLYGPVVGAAQSWSVGVEEQFYLLWPQLLQRVSKRWLLPVFVFIAVTYPYCYLPVQLISAEWGKYVKLITDLLPINFMATGAVAGFLLYYQQKKMAFVLQQSLFFILNTVLFIGFLFIPVNKVVFSFVVALQILFTIQGHFKINLRNKLLDKVGDISYGVYMYHPLVMYIVFSFIHGVFSIDKNSWLYFFAVYIGVVSMTLLVSNVSYVFFEQKFIAFKNKNFTVVKSGSNHSES